MVRYWPPGNVGGEFVENVRPPGEKFNQLTLTNFSGPVNRVKLMVCRLIGNYPEEFNH